LWRKLQIYRDFITSTKKEVQEQKGKNRADYGSQLIIALSGDLTKEYGKGFSTKSLYFFSQFFLSFPEGVYIVVD